MLGDSILIKLARDAQAKKAWTYIDKFELFRKEFISTLEMQVQIARNHGNIF